MLRKASQLRKFSLRAREGEVGTIRDFYFHDATWTVRYLVVDGGEWLERRRLLLSPMALGPPRDEHEVIPVELSRAQMRASPRADRHGPPTRRYEIAYHRHYGWPRYWGGGGLWGGWRRPAELLRKGRVHPPEPVPGDELEPGLESLGRVTGFRIEGRDGDVGHVEECLIDDETWAVVYLTVDTRNWWPGGRKVLLARQWIESLDRARRRLRVDVHRDTIREAPAYDGTVPPTREHEVALFKHYGRELRRD